MVTWKIVLIVFTFDVIHFGCRYFGKELFNTVLGNVQVMILSFGSKYSDGGIGILLAMNFTEFGLLVTKHFWISFFFSFFFA